MLKPIFYCLIIFQVSASFAQDAKITTAKVACEQGNFRAAFNDCEKALSDTLSLSPDIYAKAYYYRGRSRVGLAVDIDEMIQSGETISVLNKDLYKNYVSDSYSDFVKALSYNDKEHYEKIKLEISKLVQHANKAALDNLNLSYLNPTADEQNRELLLDAKKNSEIAVNCNPTYYLTYDIKGQIHQGLGELEEAIVSFEKCTERFKERPPGKTDILIAYVYYRMASIQQMNASGGLDSALETLNEGIEVLDKEQQKEAGNQINMTIEAWENSLQGYRQARSDLQTLKLDILLKMPEKEFETIKAFELAISQNPSNYRQITAFAGYLEKKDFDKAVKYYTMATELDPAKSHAWYNLGALYLNKGAALANEAVEKEDNSLRVSLDQKADEYFRKAFQTLAKVDELEKCNKIALSALKQVTLRLGNDEGMLEAYTKYNAKYTECFGE